MKKLLFFQSALPFGLPVIYAASVYLSENGLVLTLLAVMALAMLVSVCFKSLRKTRAFYSVVTAMLFASMGSILARALTSEGLTYFDFMFLPLVLLLITYTGNVYLRNSFLARLLYNCAWASAIGLTTYFGFTEWGIVSFIVAVALPLTLLWYETKNKQQKIPTDNQVGI